MVGEKSDHHVPQASRNIHDGGNVREIAVLQHAPHRIQAVGLHGLGKVLHFLWIGVAVIPVLHPQNGAGLGFAGAKGVRQSCPDLPPGSTKHLGELLHGHGRGGREYFRQGRGGEAALRIFAEDSQCGAGSQGPLQKVGPGIDTVFRGQLGSSQGAVLLHQIGNVQATDR